jgi:hypothetical protein
MWTGSVHIPPCTGNNAHTNTRCCHITNNNGILIILIVTLARDHTCSLMMICDVLSKHLGAMKVFCVNNFRLIYDTISAFVGMQYSVNFQNARCNNKDNK